MTEIRDPGTLRAGRGYDPAVTAPLYWLLAAVIIAMVMLVVWWLTPGIIAILWLIGLLAVAAILNAVRVRSRR